MKLQFLFLDTVDTVRRRKFYLLVPVFACLAIAAALPFFLPRLYESSVTLLVENDPATVIQGQPAYTVPVTDFFATMNEVVRSRATIGAAIDTLDLADGLTAEGASALAAAAKEWIVTAKTGDKILRLGVRHADPQTAYRMTSFLADAYISTSMRSKLQQQNEEVRFYEEKVEEYRRGFEAQQRALLTTTREELRTMPTGGSSSKGSLERVESELKTTQNILVDHDQTMDMLKSCIDGIDDPAAVGRIGALNPITEIVYVSELKSLSSKYSDLLSRYTPKYPEVQSVRRQMLNLLGKSREAVEADRRAMLSRRDQLEGQRNGILQNLSRSVSRDEAAVERKSDYAMYKELYDTMRLQLERARVARSLGEQSGTRFVILDPPRVPEAPLRGSRGIFFVWGALAGALAGILGVVLAEKFDPTIRRRRDLEVFGKPIIAFLP